MSFYKYFPGFLESKDLRGRVLEKKVITLKAVKKVEKVKWGRDQGAPKD